ncbi:MAG: hypothetical protein Q9195_006819 [Heterodermia aff. obscurata]
MSVVSQMANTSLTLAGFALQALLARHEAFMLEAENERNKMSASIRRLEIEKEELETANSSMIKENRDLLDQLENMNNSVTDSDTHFKSLTATLASTRSELERLTVLAARTTQLESQLSAMETEQLILRENLAVKEDGQRTAVQRWKAAERTVCHLHEQVDRIEREAKDERQRHAEVVGRLERRRVVELELETAAGRLKGAAAATTLGKDRGSSNVISHFVKDILQDNANLQMGVVELRDMLMGSNAEIENLREQILEHQPVSQSVCSPLKDELAELSTETTRPELHPELHVHHHYHAPSRAEGVSRERFATPRRPKKKRNVLMSGVFTPPSGVRTTRSSGTSTPSSAAAILSQTSVSIPPPTQSAGWSLQSPRTRSSVAASTVPSSPQSVYRQSSLFDHVDIDTSRPTSPESLASESRFLPPKFGKQISNSSQRSFSTPGIALSQSPASPTIPSNLPEYGKPQETFTGDGLSEIDTNYFDHATIIEEPEDDSVELPMMASPQPLTTSNPEDSPLQTFSPRLRRSASHESILTTTSPDIPTLRTQHTRLLQGLKSRTSLSITTPRIEPVINSMSASAEPSTSRGQDSKSYNRSILSGISSHSQDGPEKQTLGKRVGGWVWGKWGVAPMVSTGNLRAHAALLAEGGKMRAAGVNQVGKVRGLRVSSKVEVEEVDERALREVLDEG